MRITITVSVKTMHFVQRKEGLNVTTISSKLNKLIVVHNSSLEDFYFARRRRILPRFSAATLLTSLSWSSKRATTIVMI